MKRITSALISLIIATLMVLTITSCGNNDTTTSTDAIENPVSTSADATEQTSALQDTAFNEDKATVLGEGNLSFNFTVTDENGNNTYFVINTDEAVVGKALLDVGLIEGEEGPYGLYVKTVNGKTFDYDTDGKYWAFYVNSEMSATGVDMTDIIDGASYEFKAE